MPAILKAMPVVHGPSFVHLITSLQHPSPSSHVFIVEGEAAERFQLVSAVAEEMKLQLHVSGAADDWKQWVTSLSTPEQKGYILFFDEADALFGKRTSVEDSHKSFSDLNGSFAGLIFLGVNRSYILPTAFTQCAKTITSDRFKFTTS